MATGAAGAENADADADAAPLGPEADYFDGRSARAHRVRLRAAAGRLHVTGEGVDRQVPLAGLAWPERTRHGARLLALPGGGALHCRDTAAWDAWSARAAGRRDSWVVRVQQRWRWTTASLVVVVLLAGAGYRWGLPLAARQIVALTPPSIDADIGEAALLSIDRRHLVGPSTLAPARRDAIRRSFADAVARLPPAEVPRWRLEFRHGGEAVGANAFALPGGPIVLTDELVDRVHGDREILVGVLGHELGHLRRRHGMRLLVQASVLGSAAAAVYGDFSALFALVPTLVGQARYSRDAEREADAEAVRLLRANAISPAVMARFFAAVRAPAPGAPARPGDGSDAPLGVALASHPADAQRIAFFERAATDVAGDDATAPTAH